MEHENTHIEMEIFRAGDYGTKGRYSEAELQLLAEDYRPELLEAPLTFDHAQTGPAYGWVTGLRRQGDRLLAVLRGVPESVRQLVRTGAFTQRSVELVRELKETGRPYLRAVSLLGAATPEVKGLSPIRFSAADAEDSGSHPVCIDAEALGASAVVDNRSDGDVEVHTDAPDVLAPATETSSQSVTALDMDSPPAPSHSCSSGEMHNLNISDNAALLRGGTEYVCEQLELPLGLETEVAEVESASDAVKDDETKEGGFSNPPPTAQEAQLDQPPTQHAHDPIAETLSREIVALRAEIAQLQSELRGQAADAVFAELRTEGFSLPERHVAALRQFTQAMHTDVIQFSETESAPVAEWLRQFLRATAPRVPLGCIAGASSSAPGAILHELQVHFSERTDPTSVERHHRAIALMQHEPALAYAAALSRAAQS